MSAYNRGVRSDRSTAFEDCRTVFIFARDGGAGVDDVREHHGRTEEHIVLTAHTSIDGDIVLDFAVASQHYVRRDNDILTDVTVLAYHTARHDVTEMPYFRALAYLTTLVHIRRLMYEIICH